LPADNTALRGVSVKGCAAPLAHIFEEICLGNKYVNTLHAITAAITKLAKLTEVAKVYRAPGGVLPRSFWDADGIGIRGGVEVGFMYLRRPPIPRALRDACCCRCSVAAAAATAAAAAAATAAAAAAAAADHACVLGAPSSQVGVVLEGCRAALRQDVGRAHAV
jgi:hypothetical protein